MQGHAPYRKTGSRLAVALVVCGVATPAAARDTRHMLDIKEALATPAAKEKLDPTIKFFFGKDKPGKVVKDYGEFNSNRKTNAVGKTDKEACEWVFLSVMLAFQEQAKKRGANAVFNLRSNYKNNLVVSETQFECGAGAIMAGVAYKGNVGKVE